MLDLHHIPGEALAPLLFAAATAGTPYAWGGEHGRLQPRPGTDCSGLLLTYLHCLGLLPGDTTADGIRTGLGRSGWLVVDDEIPGDVVFLLDASGRAYHVVLVVAPGLWLGAQGGTSSTRGQDPTAFVRLVQPYGARRVRLRAARAYPVGGCLAKFANLWIQDLGRAAADVAWAVDRG
jgi:cell wall-associated NlpC family hydrolase